MTKEEINNILTKIILKGNKVHFIYGENINYFPHKENINKIIRRIKK